MRAHLEDAYLVRGAKAVLDAAQQAVGMEALALQVEHHIHHVLQHARPGNRALFGHVPHEEDGRVLGLGCAHQHGGALAHLAHAARGRRDRFGVDGLDRIHHDQGWPQILHMHHHALHVRVRQHKERLIRDPQPFGAQLDLRGRLLAGNVKHHAALGQHGTHL